MEKLDNFVADRKAFLEPPGVDDHAIDPSGPEVNRNVDDEEVAASLEDKALIAHMAAARLRHRECMGRASTTSDVAVRAALTMAMGQLSNLTSAFREPCAGIDQVAGAVTVASRAIPRAMRGQEYPPLFDANPALEAVGNQPAVQALATNVGSILADHGNSLARHAANHTHMTRQLAACHAAFGQATEAVQALLDSKDLIIISQRELIKAGGMLSCPTEVRVEQQRREVLGLQRSAAAPAAAAPSAVLATAPAAALAAALAAARAAAAAPAAAAPSAALATAPVAALAAALAAARAAAPASVPVAGPATAV